MGLFVCPAFAVLLRFLNRSHPTNPRERRPNGTPSPAPKPTVSGFGPCFEATIVAAEDGLIWEIGVCELMEVVVAMELEEM
jgi:hypothetical protein